MSVELSESVLNGRFKVSEKPLVAPGKCACCGAVDKPVVDFGFDVEFYGTVLLCGDCITEALSLLTAVFPVSSESQAQVVPLPTLNVEAINGYVLDAIDSIGRLRNLLPNSVDDSEDAEELSTGSEPIFGESTETDNALDELISQSGPDDSPDVNRSGSIFDA